MLILFTISVICFVALIGAGVAMIRHVRAGQREKLSAAPPQPEFRQHLESAVKYGSARELRKVHHQRVESIAARKEWNSPSQAVEIHPSTGSQDDTGSKKIPHGRFASRRQMSNERVDRTHFNNDYGDLTDPYPSRATSDRAASKRR